MHKILQTKVRSFSWCKQQQKGEGGDHCRWPCASCNGHSLTGQTDLMNVTDLSVRHWPPRSELRPFRERWAAHILVVIGVCSVSFFSPSPGWRFFFFVCFCLCLVVYFYFLTCIMICSCYLFREISVLLFEFYGWYWVNWFCDIFPSCCWHCVFFSFWVVTVA